MKIDYNHKTHTLKENEVSYAKMLEKFTSTIDRHRDDEIKKIEEAHEKKAALVPSQVDAAKTKEIRSLLSQLQTASLRDIY